MDPPGPEAKHRSSVGLLGHRVSILALLACLLGATEAGAAGTFYVDGADPGCSHAGPGSLAVPYCTISAAATAKGGPGTTLLVKPAIYREQVTVPASGSPGSPFVIQALGSPVVVEGTDDYSVPSVWSLSDGNVYLSSFVLLAPVQVFVDGARLVPSTDPPASLLPGTFRFIGGQGLYVNIGGDNPGTHATFVGRRTNGFRITGRAHVTIDGFTVTRTEDTAIYLLSATSSTRVVNNIITYAGNAGIAAKGCSSLVLASNVVSHAANHGISLSSGTSDSFLENNESFLNARPGTAAANGIKLDGCARNVIQRNRLHDNQDSGLQLNHSDKTTCLLNRSWNNGDHGFDHLNNSATVHIGEVAYRNTRDGISIEGGNTDTGVFNSISIDNGLATGRFNLQVDSSSVGGFVSDFNVFWNPTARSVVKFGPTAYALVPDYSTASGHDGDTLQSDPLFANAAGGDFHLLFGSVAIDSADSSVVDWPGTDAEGYGRVNAPLTPNTGVGPILYGDRGALEFQPVCGPETCDGIDNNCDDTVDDGNPDGGAPCGSSDVGECGYGVVTCSGGGLACVGSVEPAPETCDGLDNNCDASVDEGDPGAGTPCGSTDVGECSFGATACTAGALVCDGSVEPVAERCDTLDNDCDGSADEDFALGSACTSGLGACQASGTVVCSADGSTSLCDAVTGTPSSETCDGIDNNCDGATDNVPASAPATMLTVTPAPGTANIAWAAAAEASAYDLVRGDLLLLHSTGDFTTSTSLCVSNDGASTSESDPDAPNPGAGFWYLVRGVNCGGGGTFDDPQDPAQAAPRDAAIAASASACP